MDTGVCQAPLWGSKWDGQLGSSSMRIARSEIERTLISRRNWDFRSSITARRFMLESCVQALLVGGQNGLRMLPAIAPVFDVTQHLVDEAVTKMKEFPTPYQITQLLNFSRLEILSVDGHRLSADAFAKDLGSIFISFSVLQRKNATHITLYRTDSQNLTDIQSNSLLPDKISVCISTTKNCFLSISLWGTRCTTEKTNSSTNNQVVMIASATIPVKKIKTKSDTLNDIILEGAAFSCMIRTIVESGKPEPSSIAEYVRTVHRHVLRRGAERSFLENINQDENTTVSKGSSNRAIVQWSGNYNRIYSELFEALEEQHQPTALQRALDHFCVASQMLITHGVTTDGCHKSLQRLLAAFRDSGELMGAPDRTRMAESVDLLMGHCANKVSTPFTSFDGSLLGSVKKVATEVTLCVKILKLIYECDLWHSYATQVDAMAVTKLNGSAPILEATQAFIESHAIDSANGYDREDLKSFLISKYGQSDFFKYKVEIESLLRQEATRGRTATRDKIAVMLTRLSELLEAEDATISGVKSALAKEFTKKLVAKHSDVINRRILEQVNACTGVVVPRRRLEKDLITALERHVGSRYEQLKMKSTPKRNFEGCDIVVLTRVTNAVFSDIEMCEELFSPLYSYIDGFNLTEAIFELYGVLLAVDLRDLLQRWQPKNSGTDLAAVLFELYFAMRDLVEPLRKSISKAVAGLNPLLRYLEWFAPFILYWMRLGQLHARNCITNAVRQDDLSPITSNDLYTSSVVDIFKVLMEMLKFYTDLKWADKESAQQMLVPTLVESICSSVKFYAKSIKIAVIGKLGRKAKVNRDFIVNTILACGLNSLDEALVRFNAMCSQILSKHVEEGSFLYTKCNEVFLSVRSEIDACRGDIMYRIGASIRARIKSDISFLLYYMPEASQEEYNDLALFIDDQLCPLLDDPHQVDESNSSSSNSSPDKTGLLDKFSISRILEAARASMTDTSAVGPPPPKKNGYLCTNLMAISQKIETPKTVEELVTVIWGHTLQVLRDAVCTLYQPLQEILRPPSSPHTPEALFEFDQILPKKPENMKPGFHQRVAAAAKMMLEQMVLFFNDDGEGIPSQKLLSMSDRVCDHVLSCCEMSTSELIVHFLKRVTSLQNKPIKKADAIARKEGGHQDKKSVTGVDPSDETESFPAGVFVDDMCGGILRNRGVRTARPIGSLMLKMYYDHENDFAEICVLDPRGIQNTDAIYYKLRVLPRFNADAVKMRSDKMGNDTFKVPDVQSSIAIQIRAHKQSVVKRQLDAVMGEVMIGSQTLMCTTREFYVEMPLHAAGGYGGACGEALQLIRDRAKFDVEAKDFISMYN